MHTNKAFLRKAHSNIVGGMALQYHFIVPCYFHAGHQMAPPTCTIFIELFTTFGTNDDISNLAEVE